MFRAIIILAILGGVGYFAFQKLSADQVSGKEVSSVVRSGEGSSAAERAIRASTDESYDYENR
ncbi:MAG: hypothetical protein ACK5N8_03405 [Alphaproteobacteria bacterium]